MLHVDAEARDSLACDLMEAVRPDVDAFLVDWITRETLRREWFFEQPDGNCRLMASLAVRLSETAPAWGRAVAPVAEWVAPNFWTKHRKPPVGEKLRATHLTQRRRSEGRGSDFVLKATPAPRPQNVCAGCGVTTKEGQNCPKCGREISRDKLIELAKLGRIAAHSPKSQKKQAETQRRHRAAPQREWPSDTKPDWLTLGAYGGKDSAKTSMGHNIQDRVGSRESRSPTQPTSARSTPAPSETLANSCSAGQHFFVAISYHRDALMLHCYRFY